MDLRNTSLSVQADKLKQSLEKREKRRFADKAQRYLEKDDDGWEGGAQGRTGQAPVASNVSALAAISATTSQRETFTCQLCNATFLSEAQYSVHLSSAVHHKAVEKQNAARLREEQMRQSGLSDVQAMALGAAAWANTHGAGGSSHQRMGPGRGPAGPAVPSTQQQQKPGRPADQGKQGVKRKADSTTHEQMLNMARGGEEEEELHIDGWKPPTIQAPAAPHVQAAAQAGDSEADDSDEDEPSTGPSTGDALPSAAQAVGVQEGSSAPAGDGAGLLGITYGDSESESESSEDSGGPAPVSFF